MKNLENLNQNEKEELLKFPAYISLLAVDKVGEMDEAEKKTAVEFSHIKTYSCVPLLSEFYKEADKVFKQNVEQLNYTLPKAKEEREIAIRNELAKLENILLKLGKDYAKAMHGSMKTFKEHVSKAHNNVLESFIFPIPIKGLTE